MNLRSSFFIFIFLLKLSTFSQASQVFKCLYQNPGEYVYSCYLIEANITNSSEPIEFINDHIEGKTSKDVKSLVTPLEEFSFPVKLELIHEQIFEEFPNIEFLYFTPGIGMKTLNLGNCAKIKEFEIYKNEIKEILNNAFINCKNMTKISHGYCNSGSIEAGALRHLTKLEELTITSFPTTFNHIKELLSGLTNLQKIYFDNNLLENFTTGIFNDLKKLENLRMTNNKFTTIPAGVFDGLENLINLDLKSNQITNLNQDSFKGLFKLDTLNLDFNYISDLSSFPFNPLTSLTDLSLIKNSFPTLPTGFFEKNTKLLSVSFSSCDIKEINTGIFDSHLSLSVISLNNNQITSLPPDAFKNLPNLTFISFYNNSIKRLNSNSFVNLIKLDWFNIEFNQLDEIEPNFIRNFPKLRVFDARRNICTDKYLYDMSEPYDQWFSECYYNWEYGRTTIKSSNETSTSTTTEEYKSSTNNEQTSTVTTTTTVHGEILKIKVEILILLIIFLNFL
ncbi:hypothetical protein PVAND_009356 [Polypedilum vanderplanki]|uniref:L domain-like protein n=1 Tax=Polypedilum vanderplanki TaxID=319348 RepID=A0A9J6CCN1_POLVA|nr:hypothetical protein PVAND_009356 [Polypedilum vanderplanki]